MAGWPFCCFSDYDSRGLQKLGALLREVRAIVRAATFFTPQRAAGDQLRDLPDIAQLHRSQGKPFGLSFSLRAFECCKRFL